jgi:hypothetical protein
VTIGPFLLAHHGGVPGPHFYWVFSDDWGSGLETFYGFGPDGYCLQQYLDGRESIGLASDMLAIGDDGCCNLLAIGVSGSRKGQIYHIDHEFAPGEQRHELLLTSTFTEFLNRLCITPDT